MKLELKYLSPYLPYDLKLIHSFKKVRDNRKSPLKRWIKSMDGLSLQCFLNGYEDQLFIGYWQPILRPLSDLRLENEYSEYLNEYASNCIRWVLVNDVSEVRLNTFNYLIKNHFDVFNLIPQGLAIDINTLNK